MDMTNLSQRLEGLLPFITELRDQTERARTLPADLVQRLRESGIFALEVPRSLGGADAAPVEVLRAIEILARADGSTGWCAALGAANNGVAGIMSEAGAREVFSDPSSPIAGVFAPTGGAVEVNGGVQVSGRWQFASGVKHAGWLWGGCMMMQNGQPRMTPMGPDIVYAVMPAGAYEIHDTWQVSGLCGTGSHDVSANDVFVPQHRVFRIDPTAQHERPLDRMPPIGWFVSHIAAVSIGVARGALDELIALAQTKKPTFSMAVLADRPAAQLELARAEAALAAARSALYESVEDLWRTVTANAQPTPRQIAINRIACVHAAEVGAAITRTASVLAGGASIFKTASFQRHMRDAEAISHHFTVAPHVLEDAGRVLLGRAPTAPMF
jgi:indole-3-acetate monooxygenase